jgi:hypothetical protein
MFLAPNTPTSLQTTLAADAHLAEEQFLHEEQIFIIMITPAQSFSRSRQLPATQGFPNLLSNPEVHYRVHKISPLVPMRNQIHQFVPLHHISSTSILIFWPINPLPGKDLETNNETTVAMQRRCKHAFTTIELLLGTVFSTRSVPMRYMNTTGGT